MLNHFAPPFIITPKFVNRIKPVEPAAIWPAAKCIPNWNKILLHRFFQMLAPCPLVGFVQFDSEVFASSSCVQTLVPC